MIYAPVILFVYNRLVHTKQTIEALASNVHAAESDLWVFSDGPKFKEAETHVAEVREYIYSLAEQPVFRSLTVVESQENKGLANSIIQGVTSVLANADRAIILEDDLVTAPDFLKFMNDCLHYYRDKPVGSISGYSPIKNLPSDYVESVYVSKRSCSHGWATWRDRWQGVDWEAVEFDQFRKNSVLRREFDSTGADRFDRLRRQVECDIESWSVRFGFYLYMQNLTVVYPAISRVSNIGFDGSGVHAKSNHQKGIEKTIRSHSVPYKLTFPPEDARITEMFFELYSGNRVRVLARNLRNKNLVLATKLVAKKLSRLVGRQKK